MLFHLLGNITSHLPVTQGFLRNLAVFLAFRQSLLTIINKGLAGTGEAISRSTDANRRRRHGQRSTACDIKRRRRKLIKREGKKEAEREWKRKEEISESASVGDLPALRSHVRPPRNLFFFSSLSFLLASFCQQDFQFHRWKEQTGHLFQFLIALQGNAAAGGRRCSVLRDLYSPVAPPCLSYV